MTATAKFGATPIITDPMPARIKKADDGFTRTPGVGHETGGQLHDGISVKIGRTQHTQQGPAEAEGGLNIKGDNRRAQPMKKHQHVAQKYKQADEIAIGDDRISSGYLVFQNGHGLTDQTT